MDNLNKWLVFLGNLGVIAGILFLAVEIQQNTSMMRAQTRDSMTDKLMSWQLAISTNQFTAIAWARGNLGEELNPDNGELQTYALLSESNLRMWENEWYQYKMGLFDEAEFAPRLQRWEDSVGPNSVYHTIWRNRRQYFAPEFRDMMDGLAGLK